MNAVIQNLMEQAMTKMVPNLLLSQPAVKNTELGIKRIFLKGQNAINKMQHKILFSYTNMLPCSKQINYKC